MNRQIRKQRFTLAGKQWTEDGSDHDLMGYIVFTYTFHVWGAKREVAPVATHAAGVK